MNTDKYPIEMIRSHFPALKRKVNGKNVVFFDGPAGSQILQESLNAMTQHFINGAANVDCVFPTSIELDVLIKNVRIAMSDIFGVKPREVVFGANTSSLLFSFSRALSRTWTAKDTVVVTELDHRANVDPWIEAANDKGTQVQWIRLDRKKFVLDLTNLDVLIPEGTKVVAVGLASNGVGTINSSELKRITARAKKIGALVVVDAVHAVPHIPIDFKSLDIDAMFCSAYKFFGPHLGVGIICEGLFETLKPYKLKSSPTTIPGNFETGTQNHEGLAGLPPIVDFIAGLGTGATRREKFLSGMHRIETYENQLAEKIRKVLWGIPEIIMLQAANEVPKCPTISFNVKNIPPSEVAKYLCDEYGIFVGNGHFYAMTIGDVLDINKTGGWVRIGLAPYSSEHEVDLFIQGIQSFVVKLKK